MPRAVMSWKEHTTPRSGPECPSRSGWVLMLIHRVPPPGRQTPISTPRRVQGRGPGEDASGARRGPAPSRNTRPHRGLHRRLPRRGKKGVLLLESPDAARRPSSWQWQTAMAFLLPWGLRVVSDRDARRSRHAERSLRQTAPRAADRRQDLRQRQAQCRARRSGGRDDRPASPQAPEEDAGPPPTPPLPRSLARRATLRLAHALTTPVRKGPDPGGALRALGLCRGVNRVPGKGCQDPISKRVSPLESTFRGSFSTCPL